MKSEPAVHDSDTLMKRSPADVSIMYGGVDAFAAGLGAGELTEEVKMKPAGHGGTGCLVSVHSYRQHGPPSSPVLHFCKTAASSRENKSHGGRCVFTLVTVFPVQHCRLCFQLGPDEQIFIFCCGTRESFNGNLGHQNTSPLIEPLGFR